MLSKHLNYQVGQAGFSPVNFLLRFAWAPVSVCDWTRRESDLLSLTIWVIDEGSVNVELDLFLVSVRRKVRPSWL
jgi:hypothetical protein